MFSILSKDLPYQVSVSAGYEKYEHGQADPIDQLIRRADEKMYQNKQKRIKTFHNKEEYTAHTANK
ncbi:MAG: diguanylate cyclase domain-containing protein [Christensenellales bacterium]